MVNRVAEVVQEKVGDFKRWHLSRADSGHQLAVTYVECTGIVPPHEHAVAETLYYISRRGLARIDDRQVAVAPGTTLAIPPGAVHSSIREGLEPLRYVAIFIRNPDLRS